MYKRKEVIGNCVLYYGDNRDVMQDIDLSEIGACVTDPPYGIASKMGGGSWEYKKEMQKWDNTPADIKPILSLGIPSIIWGGNYFNVPPSRCWLSWNKPYFPSMADFELAWTNFDKNCKAMFQSRESDKQHPTQKPIQLMKWCISHLPKDCTGAILDPFMGSGTTGVACAIMGRSFIGIEMDEDYFNIACKRVEDAYKQGDLFI